MARIERLTSWDKKFLASLHIDQDTNVKDELLAKALMDHMGKPREEDSGLRLSAQNAGLKSVNSDLLLSLRYMTFERDLFRRRFLWASTIAVGTWAGVVITVAILWWLRAGLR